MLTDCAVQKADVNNVHYIRQMLTECAVQKADVNRKCSI